MSSKKKFRSGLVTKLENLFMSGLVTKLENLFMKNQLKLMVSKKVAPPSHFGLNIESLLYQASFDHVKVCPTPFCSLHNL